ncbi:uncharacterized protein LOC123868317 isoform X1 [Maniola jurtina]|uniref:uncharacterized protein LOC123868317 isoform X1 n=1 Tax=Maniola jurtina TaxID=191418 RepID=UPI001E68694D|nr:uncharacterized protein LOC123868317 isoform X1 [Maniola jurtina]
MPVLNEIRPIYLSKFLPTIAKRFRFIQKRNCYSIFGIKDLVQHEKQPDSFSIVPVQSSNHETAIRMAKRYFLTEHVFVRARHMDLNNDRAIDEYIIGLLKQGNSLFAKTADGTVAGFCINFAASPVDPQNLRNYAYYRQDPNTKDFLYFTAKLQETPHLWNIFKEDKVFEIKMLAVLPEYRRQGLATMLAQKSKEQAKDQGYKIVRMDCINPYDHKIAERCMLSCLVKFPVHKLRGTNAPFIKKSSDHNTCLRVFVEAPVKQDAPNMKQIDFESMFE